MENPVTQFSSVEINRAASNLCQRLFLTWSKPPTQGELQRIIIESQKQHASEEGILKAGNWWLWIRDLFIENAISKKERRQLVDIVVAVANGNGRVHLVTARSPELLHAQVDPQGEFALPRSVRAIAKFAELVSASARFLPTRATIFLADLSIDNLEQIQKVCNVKEVIDRNLEELVLICKQQGLQNFEIVKMSELDHPAGQLGELINQDGSPKTEVEVDKRGQHLIDTVTKESVESHQRMFGWTLEQSRNHNQNLAITMGFVGQAVQLLKPWPILIHNEAFIARGALNNLFTDPNRPLPVICLKDLLERKAK